MVEYPSFFAEDERVHPIIEKMEGIAYECHQFNRHWPLETGWSKPDNVVKGAKWTIAQDKEYIFYYGPIVWKSGSENEQFYYEFIGQWARRKRNLETGENRDCHEWQSPFEYFF